MRAMQWTVLAVALITAAGAMATPPPVTVDARGVEISSAAYPGTITLEIDASNLSQRVFSVRQSVPVSAGERRFHYPAWLPGNHSPTGQIEKLAGLVITAKGQRLQWQRDPLDVYTFNVRVPEGVSELQMEYQFLSPTDPAQGRTVMTPNLLNLQWNAMVLYPAGHAANAIAYAARVRYPAGWQAATSASFWPLAGLRVAKVCPPWASTNWPSMKAWWRSRSALARACQVARVAALMPPPRPLDAGLRLAAWHPTARWRRPPGVRAGRPRSRCG